MSLTGMAAWEYQASAYLLGSLIADNLMVDNR